MIWADGTHACCVGSAVSWRKSQERVVPECTMKILMDN